MIPKALINVNELNLIVKSFTKKGSLWEIHISIRKTDFDGLNRVICTEPRT